MKIIFSITALIWVILFGSCKKDKDDTPPPVTSGVLSYGRAAASFKTNIEYGGSKIFNVRNTGTTFATSESSAALREIRLQVGEEDGDRVVYFNIVVPNSVSTANGNIAIDLSVRSGLPQALVQLEKNAILSPFDEIDDSSSGTLTITKLTATEVEGFFTATIGKYFINNGSFAGRY